VFELKRSHKSVFLRLQPYYGSEWNTNVLIILCICVSFHLVAVSGTATWKCDRLDIPNYTVNKVLCTYGRAFYVVYPSVGRTTQRKKEKGLHPCPNFDSKYPTIRVVDVSAHVKLAICKVMYGKPIRDLYQRKLTERDTDQQLEQSLHSNGGIN
jgi:hypothetical protein